jgi:hypothetical protein
MLRLLAVLALALLAGGGVLAQVRVRTETIRPPSVPPPYGELTPPAPQDAGTLQAEPRAPAEPGADGAIITELARLPPAVAGMRERILKAARSGDPQKLRALMQASGAMPVFSHTQRLDPTAVWKDAYPDSEGVEALAILVTIMETAPVHVDVETPAETYIWPYFARLPLKTLTPAQKVDLFRVITGADYQAMLAANRYAFYRVGIAPDGTWRYFVAGD